MNNLPPVRDQAGYRVWRVKVGPGERTCTRCGETCTGSYCERCSDLVGMALARQALVPTLDYLRPGEYDVYR